MIFKKKKKIFVKKKDSGEVPFEKQNEVSPLILFFTVVGRNQANYFVDAYNKAGASRSLVLFAHSMPPQEVRNILGADSRKKEIVRTICRYDLLEKRKKIASDRFKISQAAKGVAFAEPIDSVSSLAVYKFLSDYNHVREKENGNPEK